jgi:hypothetical protein
VQFDKSMKHPLTLLLLLISHLALSQSVKERAYSKIYLKGTYLNEQNEIIGLQTRTDLTDTLIDNTKFRKFQMSDFKDYADQKQIKSYYESFSNGIYCLLDSSLQVVHQVNFQTTSEQTGILFGISTQIALELLHTSSNHSEEAPVITDNTPRKYFQKDAAEIYVVIIPFFEALVVAGNGQYYLKKLMGDNYNDISEGLVHDFKVSSRFDIQKGDEIQLFYRNKWYDDTTYLAEYRDKQYKNFKYSGDTIVQDQLHMKFQVEEYSYLSGRNDDTKEILVPLTKDGYRMGSMFVPFQEYQTEMKLIETQNGPGLFLQGVTFDTVGTFIYPKIVQVKSDENGMPWKTNILPFFPLVFIETGNVEGFITYSKINGVESGNKRTRTFITDRDNIREISNKKAIEVNLEIYFIAPADIRIEIRDPESEKVLVKQQSKANEGINTFVLSSKKLKSANTYEVHITYQRPNGSGSFSNSVRIKY